jgi:hypothetical protein
MFILLLGGSRALALLGRKVLEEAEYWKRLVVCSFCVCVCVCVCVYDNNCNETFEHLFFVIQGGLIARFRNEDQLMYCVLTWDRKRAKFLSFIPPGYHH